MIFLENVFSRLLLAIIPSLIWTFLSYIIVCFLSKLKNHDAYNNFSDIFSYIWIANYIIITLVLIFFIRDNISLF